MTDTTYLRYIIPVAAARTDFFFIIPKDLSVISTAVKQKI